jgi:hypothetical protein
MNESTFSATDEDFGKLAGLGFSELQVDELREGHTPSLLSSGFICTVTAECNC